MASETDAPLPTPRYFHLSRLLIFCVLILLTPTFGKAVLSLIATIFPPVAAQLEQTFLAPLWTPFWQSLGYGYVPGAPLTCLPNADPGTAGLLSFLMGAAFGLAPALLIGWLLKQKHKDVDRSLVLGLFSMWGLYIGVLSVGFFQTRIPPECRLSGSSLERVATFLFQWGDLIAIILTLFMGGLATVRVLGNQSTSPAPAPKPEFHPLPQLVDIPEADEAEQAPSLPSARRIHLTGALVICALILITPGPGTALIGMFGIISSQIPHLFQEVIITPIWTPLLNMVGYRYSTADLIACAANPNGELATLITLVSGLAIGAIGGGFQAAAIKRRFGTVQRGVVIQLVMSWGIVMGLLWLENLQLGWVNDSSGCILTNPVISLIVLLALFMCMPLGVPMLLLIFYVVRLTRQAWHPLPRHQNPRPLKAIP